ncbi:epimerase [Candidatus Marinamargulisbacteria bacterium SCGC AG-414-C22]|nr:epimerase [Candidatus Marinamargulisbacteria bacterium SCGC AG-414-C22]
MAKNIFVTGASGCIGHYVLEELYELYSDFQLHLLIRSPEKLNKLFREKNNITIHQGSLDDIESFETVIKEMDIIVHIATSWLGSKNTTKINIVKTKTLFLLANPKKLEKIIYFSTASILGKGNKPVEAAEKYGSSYVRTKYQAHAMLTELPIKDRIITVFPTLVFGGNQQYPKSHITSGVKSGLKYIRFLKYIYLDGSFHFLHAKDIARVVCYLMFNAHERSEYVLGNEPVTLKDMIKSICDTFNISQWFRLKVSIRVLQFLAKILRIRIGPWEQHCIDNPHMVFDTVSPKDFNLEGVFPDINSVLLETKVNA